MINIPINISLPQIWEGNFTKDQWNPINFIVGANGTGKSLFSEQLKNQLNQKGFKSRLLTAERLAGFEKMDYGYYSSSNLTQGLNISHFKDLKSRGEQYGLSTSAFVVLKERMDIRIKIEALLSDIFQKTIRLVEEGGFLKPKIQNINGGAEYGLKEQECHGLKELLTLLTFLYDETKNCLILDEPELHLHPQFQSFFLNEVRKIAGNPLEDPSKKFFFIITHSPYFLDLRSIDDLKSVVVCNYNSVPIYIDSLDTQDEYVLKRFLPRFNTHHKQFFFSPNPVFVEGYTDQQIITILFEKCEMNIGASGSSVIDVGGKDELGVFFKISKKLKLDCRIIADYDAFFRGKIREVVQCDERATTFFQQAGLGTDIARAIGEIEQKLKSIADNIVTKITADVDILALTNYLKPIISEPEKRHDVICSMFLAVVRFEEKIKNTVDANQKNDVTYIMPRFRKICEAFEKANLFIIPNGELEHYFKGSTIDYLNIGKKDELFHTERDYLLGLDIDRIQIDYLDLLPILFKSIPCVQVDMKKHLEYQIIEWIQIVQGAIQRAEIINKDTLEKNARVQYNLYGQILSVDSLIVNPNKTFQCSIRLNKSMIGRETLISFDEKTIAHGFSIQ